MSRPSLEIVTACLPRDLHILRLGIAQLRRFLSIDSVHVIAPSWNFEKFRHVLGSDVELIDEDELIPTMTLAKLRELPSPCFPQGAGWYFQQLLKLVFAYCGRQEHYLIWDADTILLQPVEFFDSQGRALYTKSEEYHPPYFETYRRLIGEEPNREFSFISQHMIIEKAVLRDMLVKIEKRFSGSENWAWKIMKNLPGTDCNRFSEYETYGHYAKRFYPDRVAFRELPWTREGVRLASFHPKTTDLDRLAREFSFAAFEINRTPLRLTVRWAKGHLRRWLRN
jgi:Family of unknown function (DUF6492)